MEQPKNQELAVLETQVSKRVTKNFEALNKNGIQYPIDYVPENAIKGAMFELSKVQDKNGRNILAMAQTDRPLFDSIINAMNQMLIQGLDAGKKQVYFIAYTDKDTKQVTVQLQRSYFGTVTMLKRLKEVKDIMAREYYEDNIPEFEFDVEAMTMSKMKSWNPNHKTNQLAGAFAVIYKNDGTFEVTNMTIDEIHTSWSQSSNYGQTKYLNSEAEAEAARTQGIDVKEFTSKTTKKKGWYYKTNEPNDVQSKFGGEMAKRTVINRAAKLYVNSSSAPTQLVQAYNETTENEYEEVKEAEVVNVRDYEAEIREAKDQQALSYLWAHVIPQDQLMDYIEAYQEKKEELENANAISENNQLS